jgi:hypothetical protein
MIISPLPFGFLITDFNVVDGIGRLRLILRQLTAFVIAAKNDLVPDFGIDVAVLIAEVIIPCERLYVLCLRHRAVSLTVGGTGANSEQTIRTSVVLPTMFF